MTPFVLNALLDVPRAVHEPEPERIERALAFIEDFLMKEDDPLIATAFAIETLLAAGGVSADS